MRLANVRGMPEHVRLVDIAARAGVSTATVSLALRDSVLLPAATKAKVRAVAEKLGYRPHPYVSAYMSWRRNRGALRKPAIALLHGYRGENGWEKHRSSTLREMHRGVREQLELRGYAAGEFRLGAHRPERLVAIIKARGISGLIFAPSINIAEPYDFPWADFSAVQIGTGPAGMRLPRVAHDHYHGALEAVRRCVAAGFRRPGLVIDPDHDARLQHVWRAGFEMGVEAGGLERDRVFPLRESTPDLSKLRAWFKRRRPDVIVTNLHQVVEHLLGQIQLTVPRDVRLVSLSVPTLGDRVSGINQDGYFLGAQAVDLLAGALRLHRTGELPQAVTTLVGGQWNPGTTM